MKVGVLFAGQGSDPAPLLAEWDERSPAVRRLLDQAADEAGVERTALRARAGRALRRTEVLQPALTALSLGIWEELVAGGARADVFAGHSLGEVAAVAAAGGMTPMDAVSLAAVRGRAMAREAKRHPGGMAACRVSGAALERALNATETADRVAVAAYNAPLQTVATGPTDALRALAGAIPATPLPVPGPWHHPSMRGAVAAVRAEAERRATDRLDQPWISNRHGRVVRAANEIPALLAEQLVNPVRWMRTVRTLETMGLDEVIVVGSKALRGLLRDCGCTLRVRSIIRPGARDRPLFPACS